MNTLKDKREKQVLLQERVPGCGLRTSIGLQHGSYHFVKRFKQTDSTFDGQRSRGVRTSEGAASVWACLLGESLCVSHRPQKLSLTKSATQNISAECLEVHSPKPQCPMRWKPCHHLARKKTLNP